jgi:hypothetical protein
MEVMSKSTSRRFPVTVTRLPVARCQICDRTVAYRPGKISEVLTEHYRRADPEHSASLPGSRPRGTYTVRSCAAGPSGGGDFAVGWVGAGQQ